MANIIKKRGRTERFDEAKIFESCYAACLQSGFTLDDAESVSRRVASRVRRWASGRKEGIPSSEVLSKVVDELKGLDCRMAAFAYENLMDIS